MKRIKLYITALLLLFGLQAMDAQQYEVAQDSAARARALDYFYLQARSFMEQDSIDQCYDMLEHCLALAPNSSAVMYDLAIFYSYFGKDSLAHDFLKRVVAAEPSNQDYNAALVNYYNKVGDNAAAIKVYEDMLDCTNAKASVYMSLYNLYSETGNHAKAVEMLEKIETLEGSNETIVINKLQQYMLMPDSAKAVALVLGQMSENPDDPRWTTLLGDTYMMLGNRDAAMQAYNSVLETDPDNVYTLTSLAELYAGEDGDSMYCSIIERLLKCEGLDTQSRVGALLKYVEYKLPSDSMRVETLLQEMLQLPFDEVEIAEVYVQYLIYLGRPSSQVMPVLEKILTIEPENSSAMLQQLVYAIERNDYESVVKYADNALMYIPEMLELYYYKGLSCYLLDRKGESVEVYRQGLEKRSEDASTELVSTVFSMLGDTYHELGMLTECMEAYDSALVYNPSNINVLNNYAYYLALEDKELERALEMSYKTIVEEPDNSIYVDTYAWILFLLERYEEAKAYAEKLLAAGESVSAVEYHHCGDIFALCGDIDRAVECWQKARELGDETKILNKKIKKRKYYRDKKRRK